MLIVKRQVGETVMIGRDVVVSVLNQDDGNVYLGIDAPVSLEVLKCELEKKLEAESDKLQSVS